MGVLIVFFDIIRTHFLLFDIHLLNLRSLHCLINDLQLLNTTTLLLFFGTWLLLGCGRLQVIELFLDRRHTVFDVDQFDQVLLVDLQLTVIHGLKAEALIGGRLHGHHTVTLRRSTIDNSLGHAVLRGTLQALRGLLAARRGRPSVQNRVLVLVAGHLLEAP